MLFQTFLHRSCTKIVHHLSVCIFCVWLQTLAPAVAIFHFVQITNQQDYILGKPENPIDIWLHADKPNGT